jgi:hypothetical protein
MSGPAAFSKRPKPFWTSKIILFVWWYSDSMVLDRVYIVYRMFWSCFMLVWSIMSE